MTIAIEFLHIFEALASQGKEFNSFNKHLFLEYTHYATYAFNALKKHFTLERYTLDNTSSSSQCNVYVENVWISDLNVFFSWIFNYFFRISSSHHFNYHFLFVKFLIAVISPYEKKMAVRIPLSVRHIDNIVRPCIIKKSYN